MNRWLKRQEERRQERRERLPTPITVDIGSLNIPSIIDGPCSTYKHPSSLPSIIGGEWDFNIPSVIVLDGLNIPSVITVSGIGD